MKMIYYFGPDRPVKDKQVIFDIYGNDIEISNSLPEVLLNQLCAGDFLICNSIDELVDVSVFGFNIDEIIRIYMAILNKGVVLAFDKSTQCNSMFIETLVSSKEDFESILRKCIINYKGQKDIEAKYAKKHTITAKANGNKVGIKKGTKLITKKSILMKEKIQELSKDFNGDKSDEELIEVLSISRNSFYKYKRELKEGGV